MHLKSVVYVSAIFNPLFSDTSIEQKSYRETTKNMTLIALSTIADQY